MAERGPRGDLGWGGGGKKKNNLVLRAKVMGRGEDGQESKSSNGER